MHQSIYLSFYLSICLSIYIRWFKNECRGGRGRQGLNPNHYQYSHSNVIQIYGGIPGGRAGGGGGALGVGIEALDKILGI